MLNNKYEEREPRDKMHKINSSIHPHTTHNNWHSQQEFPAVLTFSAFWLAEKWAWQTQTSLDPPGYSPGYWLCHVTSNSSCHVTSCCYSARMCHPDYIRGRQEGKIRSVNKFLINVNEHQTSILKYQQMYSVCSMLETEISKNITQLNLNTCK